jgi:hypothetical protein
VETAPPSPSPSPVNPQVPASISSPTIASVSPHPRTSSIFSKLERSTTTPSTAPTTANTSFSSTSPNLTTAPTAQKSDLAADKKPVVNGESTKRRRRKHGSTSESLTGYNEMRDEDVRYNDNNATEQSRRRRQAGREINDDHTGYKFEKGSKEQQRYEERKSKDDLSRRQQRGKERTADKERWNWFGGKRNSAY